MISNIEQNDGQSEISQVINGQRYTLWPGIVAGKAQYIGGVLEDKNDGIEFGRQPESTEITDIRFEANGESGALFSVDGKDFGCSSDVRYLALDAEECKDGWLAFSGYGGRRWRIRVRQQR